MTAADKESGRGGIVGIEEDVGLDVCEGPVMAFEGPVVVGIGVAIVAAL